MDESFKSCMYSYKGELLPDDTPVHVVYVIISRIDRNTRCTVSLFTDKPTRRILRRILTLS